MTGTVPTGCPKKKLHFLSIRAQSRCDQDMDHISIRPGLTKTVTLFLGHPVGADFRGMLLQKLFGKFDFLFKMVLVSYLEAERYLNTQVPALTGTTPVS